MSGWCRSGIFGQLVVFKICPPTHGCQNLDIVFHVLGRAGRRLLTARGTRSDRVNHFEVTYFGLFQYGRQYGCCKNKRRPGTPSSFSRTIPLELKAYLSDKRFISNDTLTSMEDLIDGGQYGCRRRIDCESRYEQYGNIPCLVNGLCFDEVNHLSVLLSFEVARFVQYGP